MKENEKEKLLALLDDPEVIGKLRKNVLGNRDEAEIKNRIVRVKEECEAEARRKLEEVQRHYEALISQMERENKENQEIAKKNELIKNQLEENYSVAETIYSIYSKLNEAQLRWFDRVLHEDNSQTDSPIELIVWATQVDNIISMWEIITSHMSEIIANGQREMFYVLFAECFRLYAPTTRGKAALVVPSVGTEYDPLKHSMTPESHSPGNIVKVVFPGYSIGNDNYKPIVMVK